jgi:hypothetical protein
MERQSSDSHVRQAAAQIGANDYLQKPIEAQALLRTVADNARG